MPRPRKYNKKNNNKNNNKKRVSTRKVYKRNYRKQTAKILQPIAEGRKYSNQTTTPIALAQEWSVVVPDSWEKMIREEALQGRPRQNTSNGFTGRSIFSRYLNMHVRINFDNISHYAQPVRFRVLYGWAKLPYTTQFQAVGAQDTNDQGVLVAYNPTQFITEQLEDIWYDFLPVNDPKRFKLKYNKSLYIKGQNGTAQVYNSEDDKMDEVFHVNRKELDFYPKWAPQKKYHMMPATTLAGSSAEDIKPDDFFETNKGFWTPSNTKNEGLWYPFFAVRMLNFADYGRNKDGDVDTNAFPSIVFKNTHYFYDV